MNSSVKYIKNIENLRGTFSRNKGIEVCAAKVSKKDMLNHHKIAKQYKFLNLKNLLQLGLKITLGEENIIV